MTDPARVVVRARAKINLDLRVLGRRDDGYHELRTIFQTLEWHDTVTVSRAPRPLEIAGDASKMPLDRSNLAWRAAAALWRASGRRGQPAGARIHIIKRIPARAGLGGGSADAAATIVALNRLWSLGLTRAALAPIAAGLGADVPFFLIGGTALGLGRGDEIYPLPDLSPRPVVVAWPEAGVSTAEAYGWLPVRRGAGASRRSPGRAQAAWDPQAVEGCRNDLEAQVEAHRPDIRRLRRAMEAAGARLARMSGSGAAVFGLFDRLADAERARAALAVSGWHAVRTRTLARSRLVV